MLLTHFPQLLPQLHHGQCVEAAVVEQCSASFLLLFRLHKLYLRINAHRLSSVLHATTKVVVVEFGIIGEQCREHLLDGERTVHGRQVIIAGTERIEKIHDVRFDVEKMWRQVGECLCQFLQTGTFESLVVGCGAYVERDVLAELFGKGTARVFARYAEKLTMLQFASFMLYVMKRILERDLLVWMRALILRYHGLLGLEIEEIKRIGELLQELTDSLLVDIGSIA